MLIFEKNVLTTLKELESRGYKTYAAGEAVLKGSLGEEVLDWDLVTEMPYCELKKLYDKAIKIDENTLRLEFKNSSADTEGTDEDTEKNFNIICDIRALGDESLEEYLSKQVFTCLAMAFNPDRGLVDPFNGKDHAKRKLVYEIDDAEGSFKKKPEKMLDAVRLCSELDFDLQKSVAEAIIANWRILLAGHRAYIRESLTSIVSSKYAGKGLSLLKTTGLMAVVLGEEVASRISASETKNFDILCKNIDNTKQNPLRRLGLLYTCFEEKRAVPAIERLEYDAGDKQHLIDGATLMIKLNFLINLLEFKKFLFKIGLDRFEYLNNLSKAQRIVYDQSTIKIESRLYMYKEITQLNQPVFIEDLVIDENDLIEAGICADTKEARELLGYVIAVAHLDPKKNERKYLLKMAKKFKKSSFARATRYIKWMR